MPPWLTAVVVPLEVSAIALLGFVLRELKRMNGTIRDHDNWIKGHEKWAAELTAETKSDIEEINRKLWLGRSGLNE